MKVRAMWLAVALVGCTEDNDSAIEDDGGPVIDAAGAGGQGGGGAGGADSGGAGGAGGAGGEAGAGGAGGQGGAGGEGGSADPCPAICERFGDCAIEVCADLGEAGRPAAVDACNAACGSNPSFAPVAGGTETCNDLVAFGRQTLDPTFGELCMADPLNPPELPECTAFGEKIATCLVAACPATASTEDILARAYISYCNQAAAQGMLNPMDAAALGGVGCDNPALANIITEQVESLGAFCAEGPNVEPDLCAAACAELGPCIPPESDGAALRDPDLCIQFCVTNPMFTPDTWSCVAEGGQCQEIIACIQSQPPVVVDIPGCADFGERVADCVEASCPTADAIHAGMADLAHLICNQQIAAAGGDTSGLEGIAEAACDEPRIASYVTNFVVDTPESEDDGALAAYCANGPLREPALCEAGCARVAPCIPEGTDSEALRDPDICAWFCATNDEVQAATWQCFADAPADCPTVLACTE